MLVIADRERAVAIAGVMGGAASEVSATTTRIAIESAWFLPASVRATSRKLGLKTEASARFERGADLDRAGHVRSRARWRCSSEIGAGGPPAAIVDVYPRAARAATRRPAPRAARAAARRPTSRTRTCERILDAPRLHGSRRPADGWQVDVPSFRVDVAREADLIEEVGRHWGFDRIPATFPALRDAAAAPSPGDRRATGGSAACSAAPACRKP